MRPWFFTNTFYGTWLPGDRRGSVTSVRDRRPGDPETASRVEHDTFGTPCEPPREGLARAAQVRLRGPAVFLSKAQAEVLLAQFIETSRHRGWPLSAAAVMGDHAHWVAAIPDEVPAARALADFKAYGSRALNLAFGRPASGRWWTEKGSNRLIVDEAAFGEITRYVVERQEYALVTWRGEGFGW